MIVCKYFSIFVLSIRTGGQEVHKPYSPKKYSVSSRTISDLSSNSPSPISRIQIEVGDGVHSFVYVTLARNDERGSGM